MTRPGILTQRITWLVAAALFATGCTVQPDPQIGQRRQELDVCPAGTTLPGIDVSYYQQTINWDQVAAAGIKFAFIRVSDGSTFVDPQYQTNWSEARRVGITRGTYQFFRPGQNPITQADLLLTEMGPLQPGDLPPVVDVEDSDGQSQSVVIQKLQDWLDHVEAGLGGVVPIIYTSPGLWSGLANSSAFAGYPLWVAHWGVTCPTMPTGWTDWVFHQTSESGSVSGISTAVDTDVFNGDAAALAAFAVGDPVCGDGYCTGDETHDNCPQDCPICEPVPPLGRIVDDRDLCFERLGNPAWWHPESDGHDNTLYWTYCVDTQADTIGVWHLTFDDAGRYLIEAYTDGDWAESQHATYQVHYNGQTTPVEVDQSATDGWTEVGEIEFAAGGDPWVRLEDLTGEPYADRVMIVFDALRLTRTDPPVLPDGGVGPDSETPLPDGGSSVDASGGDSGPDDGGRARGGCSCRTTVGSRLPLYAPFPLLFVALILIRRRRPSR